MGKPDPMSRCHDFSEGSKASQSIPTALLKPGQLILSTTGPSSLVLAPLVSSSILLIFFKTNIIPHLQTLQEQDPVLIPLILFLQDIDLP